MGLSLGGTSSKASSSSSGSQDNTYSGDQTGLQAMLGQFFRSLIPSLTSGTMTPDTAAVTTGTADAINKNYAAVGDTLQKNLAARGLGQSGQSGQATLQTELARQGAQAGNLEAGAKSQIDQNKSSLLDALNYAFTNTGATTSGSGNSSGSSFGWGASGGISGPIGSSGLAFG